MAAVSGCARAGMLIRFPFSNRSIGGKGTGENVGVGRLRDLSDSAYPPHSPVFTGRGATLTIFKLFGVDFFVSLT